MITRTARSFLVRPALIASAALVVGCGDDSRVEPIKPPQLTTPRIAFVSDRGGAYSGIQLYDPSTGSITRLSTSGDQDPAISPDGMRIAFVGAGSQLMTMAVNGSDRKSCGSSLPLTVVGPCWSPDSRWIGFTGVHPISGARNAYIIQVSGDSLRPLTNDSKTTALDWSPNGAGLLCVQHDVPDTLPVDYLLSIAPNGSPLGTVLGPLNVAITGADYSPDGTRIAFAYQADPDVGYGIEICDANGANRVVVAESNPPLEGISGPSWAPDGSVLVLSAHVSTGSADLYRATTSFSDPTVQLGGTTVEMQPDWGPKR
jgi:Tol biopolymer transport system component